MVDDRHYDMIEIVLQLILPSSDANFMFEPEKRRTRSCRFDRNVDVARR